jgi:hypothetical protein
MHCGYGGKTVYRDLMRFWIRRLFELGFVMRIVTGVVQSYRSGAKRGRFLADNGQCHWSAVHLRSAQRIFIGGADDRDVAAREPDAARIDRISPYYCQSISIQL